VGSPPLSSPVLAVEVARRETAEADFRMSEQRYRALVEHAPAATLVHDGKVWLYANPAAAQMLGCDSPARLLRRDIFEILPPETVPLVQRRIRRILERGEVTERIPMVLRRPKRETLHCDVAGSPSAFAGKMCVQAVFHDLTAHRQAELERDRFFNVALDVLCMATLDGYFTRVNPAFERLTGFTSQELTSKRFIDFVHPDDRDRTLAELASIGSGVDCEGF